MAAAAIGPLQAQITPLTFTPVDAQYSSALDRIVTVSANPNQLHIYNPVTQTDVQVGLPKPPLAVSVSPDGMYAAVGHDALISYVNLSTASIQATYAVSFTAQEVVLGQAWIYVLSTSVVSINISSGAITPSNAYLYGFQGGRLDTAQSAIYGTSGNGFVKLDVSSGAIGTVTDSSNTSNHSICGSVWISPDNTRLYDGCATVYTASANSSQDMHYLTTITSSTSVGALAQSAALNRVAMIPNGSNYPYGNDGLVSLLEGTFLQPVGQFTLGGFTIGGVNLTPHGKWVFFNNASTDIFALVQGQTSTGAAGGFAVQTFSLATPVPCGATFAAFNASSIAAGALATVAITAASTCTYQVTTNASWLQVISGGYGSGNGTLTYIARANPSITQRVGVISMGGQTLTVTQAGTTTASSLVQLAYNIVDSAYDSPLNSLVFVSAAPNELHIYNPVTQADQLVPLVKPPLSLSVRPDGAYATVGHQGYVSYVNLQSGVVQEILTTGADTSFCVLASNGYVYLFPNNDSNVYSFQIATGTETATSYYNGSGPARLYIDGLSIYQAANYGTTKWNIATGVASPENLTSPPSSCQNLWLNQNGLALATACATIYSTSETPSADLQYLGDLSNTNSLVWASESAVQLSTAVIPTTNYQSSANDTQVQMYGDAYQDYVGTFALPQFIVNAVPFPGHGKYLFWNTGGTSIYVVEQADSTAKLLSSFAVETIAPSSVGSGCTFTLGSTSAIEPASLGFDSVSVTTTSNCVWTASSSASWVTITAGSFSFGSGDLAFSFTANPLSTPRAATLTIAGQTFTVTQTGAAITTYTISGQVTRGGIGLSGVEMVLSTGATTTTDSSGNYSFGSLAPGATYTVSAVRTDYTFTPLNATFSTLAANQTANFKANIAYDFNGGTGPDIVFQDPVSGSSQVWYLGGSQGVTLTGAASLAGPNAWHIVGVADFDGNGTPDLVWQDPVSGTVQVWYLGGAGGNQILGAANLAGSNSWRVVSIADFNRDGQPDLMWQDPVSGSTQIWYLGGTKGVTLIGAANVTAANSWRIVGSGDFNGDGYPDIVWQDPVSGTVQVWYMGGPQGNQIQSAAGLAVNPWHVVAIADFNSDGHPDLVFRDPVSGGSQVFFYTGANGTTFSTAAVLSGPNSWSIVAPH